MVEKKPISELPPSTVQLITATQIATSVSNIIKELVENSMDAGATVIRVKLENFGLSKIEVVDNGCGVTKEDALKMALPHFTSKISQHEDLESLTTYGFRGEALAAVCAVAKVSVTTKTANDPVASSYTMDSGGNVVEVKPSHLSQGTLVVATSLFWNVPVRKQVYQTPKKKKEELSKVEDLLLNFGLIHPELHLSLHHDHNLVWQKSRVVDLKSNIQQTLGHPITSHMEFSTINENSVDLYLMVPTRTAPIDLCFRNKTDRCFTFVNQRPVLSKDIEKLMKEMYAYAQEGQKSKIYPIYFVSLQMPGDELDINLEPNKSRVLLKNQSEVLEMIRTAVTKILGVAEKVDYNPIESQNQSDCIVVNETLLDESEVIVDESLFRGFDEPFDLQPPSDSGPKSITIGSSEWSRGLATDEDGRIVHPVQVLRQQLQFPKRISDPDPPSGNLAKRAKLVDSFEASRIVGPDHSDLEMVNGKVRKIPSDPYGEYCKEMRSELLSQNPLMNFNELSHHLSQGWQNLDKSSREKYEGRSDSNKQRYAANKAKPTPRKSFNNISNTSMDRYLQQTPFKPHKSSVSAEPPAPSVKPCSIQIELSMKSLTTALPDDIPPSDDNNEKWSCLKKLDHRSWLCSNGSEIMAVNFDRLYELILFERLSLQHILPSKCPPSPIKIHCRMLEDPGLWDALISLSTEWETATTMTITDPRIVFNGLAIRLCKEEGSSMIKSAEIFKIPICVDNFGLGDLAELLRRIAEEDSTVSTCRLTQSTKFLKMEAAKLAKDRCIDPEEDELCELLDQWLSTDPEDNCCLHGEPVVWSYLVSQDAQGEEDDP